MNTINLLDGTTATANFFSIDEPVTMAAGHHLYIIKGDDIAFYSKNEKGEWNLYAKRKVVKP